MNHILICFLSDIHKDKETQHLVESTYMRKNQVPYISVQTNESALRCLEDTLAEQGEHLDCIFYFLSDHVGKDILQFLDDQDKPREIVHEAIFLQRLQQEYPILDYRSIPYEDNKDTAQSIQQVTDMTKAIMTYLTDKNWSGKDVTLHADMTGGPRHASMMMLSIMQLLKYREIQTGHVLYSNRNWKTAAVKVEDVTEVYRMFNLVSGADEFVNFGSVEEIEAYFKGRPKSEELKKLLNTMKLFSDAIKICRTKVISETVNQLYKALKKFEESKDKNLQESLFLQILYVFKQEYGDLLTDSATDFDIIRWCVRKGFLQQAMTLCTEWLPTHIVERKICYPKDNEIKLKCYKNKKDYHTWQQNFITTYFPGTQSIPLSSVRNYIAKIFETYDKTKNIEQSVQTFPVVAKQCRAFFREFEQQKSFLAQRYIDYKELKNATKKYPALYRVLHVLWADQLRRNVTDYSSFISFIGRLRVDTLIRQLIHLNIPEYEKALNVNLDAVENQDSFSSSSSSDTDKWERRLSQYEDMFARGIMESRRSTEDALQVLQDYYRIRTGRNEMNHANDESVMMSVAIKQLIQTTLDKIEGIS